MSHDTESLPVQERLLFAIPKKGRLYDKCVKLLQLINVDYRRKNRLDIALSTNMEVALVFLPAADIPTYVSDGRVDLGITGQDMVAERKADVRTLTELHFGKCRLCVQAPVAANIKEAKDLAGKRIVTSFPHLASEYFKKLNSAKDTHIEYVSGSVEVACTLGLADGIVDLVETGDTMRAAGLEVVSDIMTTNAVLIENPHSKFMDLALTIQKRIEGVITAEKYQTIEYNVPRAKLPEAVKITPGKKSPTLCPLEDDTWVAVKSLVLKKEVAKIMDRLVEIGATDILIFDLANCRA
eukprot:Nk52_evm7s545 gene=Nk52_evmTU7s545